MGLDDDDDNDANDANVPLHKLKKKVLLQVCSSIDKFGWDKFRRHIPSDWGHDRDDDGSNYDSLRKLQVPLRDFVLLLCDLKLIEATGCLVSFVPVVIRETFAKTERVERGETLRLECKARGYPSPTFKWYRRRIGENKMSLIDAQTASILRIDNFGTTDVGVYACKATNVDKLGKKHSVESVRVTVMELVDCSGRTDGSDKLASIKPVIIRHPVGHPEVHIGAGVVLEVEAEGEEPLVYEWFRNGQLIPGIGENKLEIPRVVPELEERSWSYQCMVSNKHARVMSQPATVQLVKKTRATVYQAEDKVALLIGNGNYVHLHPLLSPVEDVTTLANRLKRENFKVIALSDLDLIEMKNAVELFCSLLDKGIYGFFYYAGHGFEYNNQRYMQPINSMNNFSIEGSLCAEFVHAQMERKKPRLAALLFDMCRTERERTKIINGEQTVVYKPDPHPNFIIAFATIFQKRAYETQGVKNGVFVSHLKKYMNEKISIQSVIDNVIADVNADPIAGKLQHPSTHKALPEDYSLTDRIFVTDKTAADIRNGQFQQITVCPKGIFGPLPDFVPNVTISLSMTPHKGCVLNGLDMVAKIYSPYPDMQFFPFIKIDNENVNVKEIPIKNVAVKENETACGVSVFYLQKMREKILATISICDENKTIVYREIGLDLGMPLVMSADLSLSNERSKPVEEDSWTET